MGKFKKADFQKVKLKVGRRVEKGTNVTNTTFKAKKIVVPAQLKEYVGEAGEKVKYDLEELAKRIGQTYGNSSLQVANLNKIKKIFSENGSESGSLLQIVTVFEKSCSLVSFPDYRVRKAALGVIKQIASSVSEIRMWPCFPVLRILICRASTHVNDDVRKDSLLLIQIIVEHYPQALCDSKSILRNFLSLISPLTSAANSNKRQLFSNPDETITGQEWRIKVLSIFEKYLDANIAILSKNTVCVPENPIEERDSGCQYMIIQRCGSSLREKAMKFSMVGNQPNQMDCLSSDMEVTLMDLVNLLIDIWREAVPRSHCKNVAHDNNTTKVMMIILQTLSKLAEWINLLCKIKLPSSFLDNFKQYYAANLQPELFSHFPIAWSTLSRRELASLEFNLNIGFCKVFASIVLDTSACDPVHQKAVVNYLFTAIRIKSKEESSFLLSMEVLKKFLLSKDFCSHEEVQLDVLLQIYRSYLSNPKSNLSTHKGYLAIQDLFLSLLLNFENPTWENNTTLKCWMEYLPEEFVTLAIENKLDKNYLSVMKKVAGHGYPAFLASLKKNFPDVISILRVRDENVQKLVALFVTKVENFSSRDFNVLFHTFSDPSVYVATISHILLSLTHRVNTETAARVWKTDYLNFLCNVIVSLFQGDRDLYGRNKPMLCILAKYSRFMPHFFFDILPFTNRARYETILDVALNAMNKIWEKNSRNKCIDKFLSSFLDKFRFMSFNTIISLAELISRFLSDSHEYRDRQPFLTKCYLAMYVLETALHFEGVPEVQRKNYSILKFLPQENTRKVFELIYETSMFDKNDVEFIGHIILQIMDTSSIQEDEIIVITAIMGKITDLHKAIFDNEMWFKEISSRI